MKFHLALSLLLLAPVAEAARRPRYVPGLVAPTLAQVFGPSGGSSNSHTVDDAATNTASDAVTLDHTTSGTPAAGFGVGALFTGESATVSGRTLGRVICSWTTATDATRDSECQIYTVLDGTTAKRFAVRSPLNASHATIYAPDGTEGAILFAYNASISGIMTNMGYLRVYGGSSGIAFGQQAGDGNAATETGLTAGTSWNFGSWATPTAALQATNGAVAKPIFIANDGTTPMFTVGDGGNIAVLRTVTAAGTTGNQTINKPLGTVNLAAGTASLVVTNSQVDASTIVICGTRTNDATCTFKAAVSASGSYTIHMSANCTAETSVGCYGQN